MLSGPTTYLEKPVTAETFVRAVAAATHVDLESGETAAEGPEEQLRREARELLSRADPTLLQRALRLLRGEKEG
jgi:hypothetical protein